MIIRDRYLNEIFTPSDDDWDQKKQLKKNHLSTDIYLTTFYVPIFIRINYRDSINNVYKMYRDPFKVMHVIKKILKKDFTSYFEQYMQNVAVDRYDKEDGFYKQIKLNEIFEEFFEIYINNYLIKKNEFLNVYYKFPKSRKFAYISDKILYELNKSGIFNHLPDDLKLKIKRIEAERIVNSHIVIRFYTEKPFSDKDIKRIKKFFKFHAIDGWGDKFENNLFITSDSEIIFRIYFWTHNNKKWKIKVKTINKKIQ